MTSVLILALLLAQQVTSPEKCALAGTAVDAITGAPLGKVEIIAQQILGDDPGASTTTDARGNFRIVDINPAQYRILASRNGYLDTAYGARKSSQKGNTITLSAGQNVEGLQIKLTPFGVIAGAVRDADGEPLAGAQVGLFISKLSNGQRRIEGYDSTDTNDLGEFRFPNLPAGRFYVSAEPSKRDGMRTVDHSAKSDVPPEFPVVTFYPGVADPSAAAPIDLDTGARITNAGITMRRGQLYTIAAHVEAEGGMRTQVRLKYADADLDIADQTISDQEGNLKITGVPSGSYVLQAEAGRNKPFDGTVDLYNNDAACNRTSVPVVVDRASVEGLRIELKGCATVTGHVVIEGQQEQKRSGNRFVSVDPYERESSALVKNDGTFHMEVSSGRHSLVMTGAANEHLYVRSVRLGNQDILRNGFSASPLEQLDVEIVLASDGGTVSGTVNTADDKPAGGAAVVLIPNDPALRARRDFTWNTVADQNGHFEFKGVAPGEYEAFAWDDIEEDDWFDAEVLKNAEGKGESVSVKAKETSPAVTIRVIP